MAEIAYRAHLKSGKDPVRGMFVIQFLIAGIGAAVLFSASWSFARAVFGDPFYIWRRQIIWLVTGFLGAYLVYRLPKSMIRKSVPVLVWAALVLNLMTYLPGLGYSSGGARRWIEIFNLTFQPSELTRVALVLYLARMLEKNENRLGEFRDGLLPPLLIVSALVLTVYFQNDFSTAAYLLVLAMVLFFAAGVSRALIVSSAVGAILSSVTMLLSKPYRLERLRIWLNPYSDPSGAGYQLVKAHAALEQGGLWGRGFGRGIIKRGGLPAAHSDFVVAVIGEENGLVGIFSVLGLFTVFAIKGWQAAGNAPDTFSKWAIFGLITGLYWQVLINFAVVGGLLPSTGIPLPFFSAGGSSAFMALIMFALILNLSEVRR